MSTDNTAAQRQAAHTQRLIDQGGRRITVRIPPDLNAALSAELHRTGVSANALVLTLLQNYLAKR